MAAVAACNGGPGASDTLPPTAPPPPSTSADVPTAGPSAVIATAAPSGAGARVAIHWEPDTALDPWEINAVAAAEGGWVGLGNCKVDGTVDEQCAVSITSADGRTWAAHGISGNHLADGYDIVRVGDRWLVLEGRVWTSADGVEWEQGATVKPCCGDADASYIHVSAGPNGALVATIPDHHGLLIGPVVSTDGGHSWERVDQGQFESDTFQIDRIAATQTELLLSGGPCLGCIDGFWSSTDGRTWTKVIDADISPGWWASFASDGTTAIAAASDCPNYDQCRTDLWSRSAGGEWGSMIDGLPIRYASIVTTDAGFIAIGDFDDQYVQLASVDGRTWDAVEDDGLRPSFYEDCEVNTAVALRETIRVHLGLCGWWRGTVDVTPG